MPGPQVADSRSAIALYDMLAPACKKDGIAAPEHRSHRTGGGREYRGSASDQCARMYLTPHRERSGAIAASGPWIPAIGANGRALFQFRRNFFMALDLIAFGVARTGHLRRRR